MASSKKWFLGFVIVALLAASAGCSTDSRPVSSLSELIVDSTQVRPLPSDDPDIAKLRAFLDERGLRWHVDVGATGASYCASAYKPPYNSDPHSYHIECDHFINKMADKMMADYTDNKPGFDEQWDHKPIAEGGPR